MTTAALMLPQQITVRLLLREKYAHSLIHWKEVAVTSITTLFKEFATRGDSMGWTDRYTGRGMRKKGRGVAERRRRKDECAEEKEEE